MTQLNRRTMLRGLVNGAKVAMALPLLDIFLDVNGQAMAATGQRIPVRFGTWIWGCGFVPERWVPTSEGADYTMPVDLEPLAPYRKQMAILTGFDVKLDGVANKPHVTGNLGLRTGVPVPNETVRAPTLDVLIGEAMGQGTRFGSIELSASGIERSYSFRGAGSPNPSETSPLALYQRIFGEGFQDPNAASFTPDPEVMVRKSVLSAVAEDRQRLMKTLGASDRQRMDEYFTAVRELEQRLELQLQPPARLENFTKPKAPEKTVVDGDIENVMINHKIMAGLLAQALACNQTRVFNMLFSDTTSNLRRSASSDTHHTLTHEEPVNPKLGYQEQSAWFAAQSMVACRDFVDALAGIKEGDGTLLDNTLLFAHSDCSIAKAHAVEGIPMMVIGGAGGRVRTGFHKAGRADSAARVGLSLQQAMGVQVEKWGTGSMDTNRTVTELVA
ncbi:DUF1552 domain-containing protein [Novosphingobium sp. RD2P27]|uniref:DUF1552 domain-containing protein n=1 Tax=Novosphingobium kalidii TaxID=3230299 RepID=A0ABV2D1V7_9SPHN